MIRALLLLLAAVPAFAWSWPAEYPISFKVSISSDVAGKYAAADSQDLVIDARDARALFDGDSISERWVTAQKQRDVAVSGTTTAEIGVRFAQEIGKGSPRYVHILAGTNDWSAGKQPDTAKLLVEMGTMIDAAKARRIQVIVGTVLPMDLTATPFAASIPAYNAQLKSLVLRKRAIVADYYAAMVLPDGTQNRALFNEDGGRYIHPNAAGYAVMDQVLQRAEAKVRLRQERPAAREHDHHHRHCHKGKE